MHVASEQDGPPPIPSRNQGETASTESSHSNATTVQGNSDGFICSVDPVNNQHTSLVTEETPDPIDVIMHDEPQEVDMDLLSRIHGLYRLLDLISEQGSGGTVDKIIISQESVAKLVNDIRPGAYTSMTKIDFNALDNCDLKPIGVYGSTSAIVDFLLNAKCVDHETAQLLLVPRRPEGDAQQPILRSGLYFLNARHVQPGLAYIIFWPEDTTWDDSTRSVVSRNRATFIRFLTKLSDQVVALISDEHSAKLVFQDDANDPSLDFDIDTVDDSDRLFDFEVRQTGQQDETADAVEGFKISHPCMSGISTLPPSCPETFDMERLQPKVIIGDMSQALMSAEYIPEKAKRQPIGELRFLAFSDILKSSRTPRLVLDSNLDLTSLDVLIRYGLDKRCRKVYTPWLTQRKRDEEQLKKEETDGLATQRAQNVATLKRIKPGTTAWLVMRALDKYPALTKEALTAAASQSHSLQELQAGDDRFFQSKEVQEQVSEVLRAVTDHSSKMRYPILKDRLRKHLAWLNEHPVSTEQRQRMIDLLGTYDDYDKKLVSLLEEAENHNRTQENHSRTQGQGGWNVRATVSRWIGIGTPPPTSGNAHRAEYRYKDLKLPRVDDAAFLAELCVLRDDRPAYADIAKEIIQEATDSLGAKLKKVSKDIARYAESEIGRFLQEISSSFSERRLHAEEISRLELRDLIRSALEEEPGHPTDLTRVVIRKVTVDNAGYATMYRVDGDIVAPLHAGIRYRIHLLELTQADTQTIDPDHIPQPIIRRSVAPSFVLPPTRVIRFIRLIGPDRCLLVVQDTQDAQGILEVYMDTIHGLGTAIQGKPKKVFHLQKLGSTVLFAVDESKRLLTVYASTENHAQIIPYIYEKTGNNLTARGGAINITRWFDNPPIPRMRHAVFISGTEELLLVDETGVARIFSLVTEQFRPATYSLDSCPISIHAAPDGAAFLVLDTNGGTPRLLCYHLASFGSGSGIEIQQPTSSLLNASFAASCLGRKESFHGIWLDATAKSCSSIVLRITSKTSEYAFRDTGRRADNVEQASVNNSLIDCHSDVWTRYPVQAAIQRETAVGTKHCPRSITFISSRSPEAFTTYFKALIRDFEQTTRKPTRRQLADIRVSAWPSFDPTTPRLAPSQFKTGDWLVGLFCLIPIHIAVTGQNRFIPLRDGVISPDFEQSLLGADVAHIAEALSFGWYESIFASYMARKSVKVVTSMGEQSVGKSYALNHFVDTSFAGSAMRCTEGVWLSVTPTQDALVVSMDFEGVNSIERSAQEDTLLVLFNAAISNLVLFRNNFALSRDITSSFKSFQSSTKVLDPSANPSLFRSTLAIIIKDVIDSDTREIVNEFSLKFQRIVRDEAGDNFISKLHRGKLAIIPWPVIQSSRFYELFGSLKSRLDKQPSTHKSAGEFLLVLKMLMAKLKACDWGALDQNLATQRVQHLAPFVTTALVFGSLDPGSRSEPLKNLETDEIIPGPPGNVVFHVSGAKVSMSAEECLASLRSSWDDRHNRFRLTEEEFLAAFNQYLLDLANARVQQVRTWLEQNTSRFAQHADVQALFRSFQELAKELKSGVALCGATCGTCSLLCLSGRQHDGAHDCYTNHKCHHACDFVDQHNGMSVPACDMPAGHNGRHTCGDMPHQCGQPCVLGSKDGCLHRCCKPSDHDEQEEHICAARTHACGAPCSLQVDGKPLCTRRCVTDCREDHERHCCALALSCPVKCELCNSFCSAGDHFHALQDDAVHLCGHQHDCTLPCQLPGVCHVATTPQSIESTFVGRHERFQYTKFTQEARRLPCIVPVPPDKLKHEGRHVHSTAADVFHFCHARCEHCEYYCTLPLGHSQREHATSHGSMSNTVWFVHGDDDGAVEVEGRKYAAGDSGAPMLCNMVCKSLRRHIHVDSCRADDDGVCGGGPGVQHIDDPTSAENQDLISHRLFWERSGFADPYTQQEQADFDLCDHKCGGHEHDPTVNPGVVPSYCILPLFHPPVQQGQVTFNSINGYISGNGHAFPCKNPAQMQRAFHVIFLVDKSGSMSTPDHQPLANTPMSQRVSSQHNNRYGAVLSALYAFWSSREVATRQGTASGARQDSYSIVLFDHQPEVLLENDNTSTPGELVESLIGRSNWYGGTDFDKALTSARTVLEQQWNAQRTPVVIFLSDGECGLSDEIMYDLCRSAVRAGSALSFHAVSFGTQAQAGSLRRMVQIAMEIYDAAPRDPLAPPGNPCSYSEALDSIQLANTFLAIADSLHNPRATLKRRI